MKLHCIAVLIAIFVALFTPDANAQSSPRPMPTELSKMDVGQFISWFVSTRWEYTDGAQKLIKFRFVTPSVVVVDETSSNGNSVTYYRECTLLEKGTIEWKGNSFDENAVIRCKVDEALDNSFVQADNSAFRAKMISRGPMEILRVSPLDFLKWLDANEFLCEIGTISFPEPSSFFIKSNTGEVSRGTYRVKGQGVVSFKSQNGIDSLMIVNQLPSGFRLIHNGKIIQGMVQQRKGKPPVALTSTSMSSSTSSTPVISPPSTVGAPMDGHTYPEIQLASQNAGINGLLISDLGNSRYAGESAKLSVSALKVEGGSVASLAFNQEVGPDMSKALEEVRRFHTIRHGGWPRNYAIQLTFADKYTSKDGPSAAVACALILESIITGVQLSSNFAVTGDMNADGTVQPIGGVAAKLRGAGKGSMEIVAIPEKNRTSAVDLLITEGVTPFLGAQIVSINTFEEALALASANKPEATQKALDNFKAVIATLKQNPAALRTVATVQILSEVSTAIPNHVSAKLLLAAAQNRVPGRLSPAGSLEAIDQAIGGIMEAVGSDLSAANGLDAGQLGYAKTRLNRLRSQVDTRVNPLVDAWLGWAALADQIIIRRSAPPHVVTQFRAAAGRINSEAAKLKGNVEFNEALER